MSNRLARLFLRRATELDHPLIFNSWLQSYRHSEDARKLHPKRIYYSHFHTIISRILERQTPLVLSDRDDPEFVFGWIAYEQIRDIAVVHYIYVKREYREQGIARLLAREAGVKSRVVYTFKSKRAEKLAAKVEEAEYMPIEEWLK